MAAKAATPAIIFLILIDVSLLASLIFPAACLHSPFSEFQVTSPGKCTVYYLIKHILVEDCFVGIWYYNIREKVSSPREMISNNN